MSSLKDKIFNYEVTPPPGTWEKIAINLDDAELRNKFPQRLYNFEATPPTHSWEKVDAALNAAGEPARPVLKRIIPFARYAVAAIFIGAVAFGIIKLTAGNDNGLNTTAQTEVDPDSSESGKNRPGVTKEIQITNNLTNEDDSALEPNKSQLTATDRSPKTTVRRANPARNLDRNAPYAEAEASSPIYAYEDHVPRLADRYVMLMTPDGNIIRMAKKWSDLLCCVSGEEQDAECKDQLKKWQQKMATSSLAPSPANFMDILGLVNSLNEGTEL